MEKGETGQENTPGSQRGRRRDETSNRGYAYGSLKIAGDWLA